MRCEIQPDSLSLWITGRETAAFCEARRTEDRESLFHSPFADGRRTYDGLSVRIYASATYTSILIGGHKQLATMNMCEEIDLKDLISHFLKVKVKNCRLPVSHPCSYLRDEDFHELEFKGWSRPRKPAAQAGM